jgi:hypothetical protein
MNDWRPLEAKSKIDFEHEMYEGVPTHLEQHLINWIREYVNEQDAARVCLQMRITQSTSYHLESLLNYAYQDEDSLLNVLDCILFMSQSARTQGGNVLRDILKLGGSVWTLQSDYCSLARRVSEELTKMVDSINAGDLIAKANLLDAWKCLHKREPDYSLAYSLSVKALETLLIPITIPNDGEATLGKILGYLNDNPENPKNAFSSEYMLKANMALKTLLTLIWKNQDDRHGTKAGVQEIDEKLAEFSVYSAILISTWVQNEIYF